jgi:3-deoxy-D-manno-octulosonic-acid transferase
LLYSFFISAYVLAIRLASFWNPKARAWRDGRKHWRSRLMKARKEAGSRKVLWVHCASLGEFEQGRPVIEALRERYPGIFILLSFFSPSGYQVRKEYEKADAVIYLPADTPVNARDFISILSPDLAIFVKYEYWLNLLGMLKERKVPVLMISSIFREGQVFFRWYGQAWRKALLAIDHFFVQDETSAARLSELGILNRTVAGDTRFDRVLQVAGRSGGIPEAEAFCRDRLTLVAGSTWKPDEDIIRDYLTHAPGLACIIAPHEISETHLRQLEARFPGSIRFSKWKESPEGEFRVLVMDNIGMLSGLYRYGHVAYIGGGFGKGIHNTLEAAVHGKPVIFGPRYEKFREAVELIREGGGFCVEDTGQFRERMDRLLGDSHYRDAAGEQAGQYVRWNAGATEKILSYIQENRLLTN